MFQRIALRTGLFAVALASLLSIGIASAHESRDVGVYRFTVGFFVEPAYEGQKNGIDLRITKEGQPLLGAEKTLKADVTFTATQTTKSFPLRTLFNDPGHYTADFFTTAPGQYAFHFTGNLEGTAVDQTFTSGDKFGNVEAVADLQFPQVVPQVREVQASVATAVDDAASAKSKANLAMIVGVIGIVVGVVGLGVAGAATMKKKA